MADLQIRMRTGEENLLYSRYASFIKLQCVSWYRFTPMNVFRLEFDTALISSNCMPEVTEAFI